MATLGALIALEEAHAATATARGPDDAGSLVVEFLAGVGEANSLLVEALFSSASGFQIVFRDSGAPITPLAGCTAISPNEVICGEVSAEPVVEIRTGDLDDSVTFSAFSTHVFAEISGGEGNDVLRGGPGGETFTADPGSDIYSGGGAFDTITYRDRSEPVFVSMDGVANDGATGEEDLVGAGIEVVSGGHGNDTLGGTSNRELISGHQGHDKIDGKAGADDLGGGAGNDVLLGGPGRDYVDGGGGNDRLLGGLRNDWLIGGRGNDGLSGGQGSDLLRGGPGPDRADGGADRDLLLMKDGYVDRVIGGPDRDRARVDRGLDRVMQVERLI